MTVFDEARELTEWEKRLEDVSPVWPGVQRFYNAVKDRHFRSGMGPDGPHRPLKPSTRKHHRTGIPLNNTGDLRRSFSEPGSAHYQWTQDAAGWEHTSTHTALPHLERRGYSVVGLEPENYDRIDDAVAHYLDTGEVKEPA